MLKENRMIQAQLEKLEWGLPVCMHSLPLVQVGSAHFRLIPVGFQSVLGALDAWNDNRNGGLAGSVVLSSITIKKEALACFWITLYTLCALAR